MLHEKELCKSCSLDCISGHLLDSGSLCLQFDRGTTGEGSQESDEEKLVQVPRGSSMFNQ